MIGKGRPQVGDAQSRVMCGLEVVLPAAEDVRRVETGSGAASPSR